LPLASMAFPTHQPAAAPPPTAGVFRRLAAGCYDALLLGAVWMLATLAIVALRGGEPVPPGQLVYQLLLLGTTALFFITSWLRGGQTLGMRAWRLKVERESGAPLDARTGIVRFIGGLLSVLTGGLGLLWLWIDRDELTWHDRLAGTRVVVVPKQRH
jgi:uncharacterized RDD family membrane protein YckC